MVRIFVWGSFWCAALLWSICVRPFLPAFLPIEPCIPLVVLSLTLGEPRYLLPMLAFTGIVLDAFQPFPRAVAFESLLILSILVWFAVRFFLASRSFYSSLILVVLARLLLAGLLYLLGPDIAVWSGDRAILPNPLFFLLTTIADACLLLVGFRMVSRPLLGSNRVGIAR